jgi:hypothetical protein
MSYRLSLLVNQQIRLRVICECLGCDILPHRSQGFDLELIAPCLRLSFSDYAMTEDRNLQKFRALDYPTLYRISQQIESGLSSEF